MTHSFTVVLADVADLSEAHVERLFAAGCDDSTPQVCAGVACLDFDREAASPKAAIESALAQVKAAGFKARRVEPDDLVTQAEIARRLKRSRASVGLLIHGQRGPGSFPEPVHAVTSLSPLWSWAAVAEWAAKHGMLDAPAGSWARLLADTNLRLSRSSDAAAKARTARRAAARHRAA